MIKQSSRHALYPSFPQKPPGPRTWETMDPRMREDDKCVARGWQVTVSPLTARALTMFNF